MRRKTSEECDSAAKTGKDTRTAAEFEAQECFQTQQYGRLPAGGGLSVAGVLIWEDPGSRLIADLKPVRSERSRLPAAD